MAKKSAMRIGGRASVSAGAFDARVERPERVGRREMNAELELKIGIVVFDIVEVESFVGPYGTWGASATRIWMSHPGRAVPRHRRCPLHHRPHPRCGRRDVSSRLTRRSLKATSVSRERYQRGFAYVG
jgi:hypothetical protein